MTDLLRALAYEPDFFDDAVHLIRRFAHEKEESNHSGEAVNVFKSLFYIYFSGTHAPPAQRIKILEKLAHSTDARDQSLLFSGLAAMLECNHFTSVYSFEFGARKRDFGYNPRTRTDIEEWYREIVSFCARLSKLPRQRERIRKMIARQFRFLVYNTRLTNEFIALADGFAADGGWPEGWAGARRAAKQHKGCCSF